MTAPAHPPKRATGPPELHHSEGRYPSWRELHARGQKLLRLGTAASDVLQRLGVSAERWQVIVQACGQRVVAMEVVEQD